MKAAVGMVSAVIRPQAAGVARAVVGVAAVLKAFERAPVLERLADPSFVRVPYLDGQPSLADVAPALVIAVWIVLAVAFAVGYRTRAAGVALTALLIATLLSDQQLYSNHLHLLIWVVGLLTLAGPGAALSLDARQGRGRPDIPAWPIALVRLELSVLYLFAGISKINAIYLSGSVVAVSLRSEGPLAIPGDWRSFELMAAAATVSIITEVGLAFALWLPRWRRTAFVVGLALHTGIAIWFDPTFPLVVFALIALSPYVLFLDLQPRPSFVIFDDSCSFCSAWVRWFRRLDWLGRLVFIPSSDRHALVQLDVPRADADRALQLLRSGRRVEGFDAVIGIMEQLPISFLWAPLLRLWPVRQVGRRTYRRVAQRRQCSINLGGGRRVS